MRLGSVQDRAPVRLQAVARPAHGLDGNAARTELAPQGAHDRIHDVAAARVLRPPHLAQQVATRDRLPLALTEMLEEPKLEWRQGDRPTAHGELPRPHVPGRLVVDTELGANESGKPAVDGTGAEVERNACVLDASDLGGLLCDWAETELLDYWPVRGHVVHDDVHPPKCRP